jgi:hypothetical protein
MPSIMKMIKKRSYLFIALLLVIALSAVIYTGRGHFYDVDLFKSGNGWGYDVLVKNKLYIHQPYMPAVEGQVPFSSRESARKIGRLVIKKIRNHEIPAVTAEEIKAIIKD